MNSPLPMLTGQPPHKPLSWQDSDGLRRAGDLAAAQACYRDVILSARERREQRAAEVTVPMQARTRRLRRRLVFMLGLCVVALVSCVAALLWSRPAPQPVQEEPSTAIQRWAAERLMWRLVTSMSKQDWEDVLRDSFAAPSSQHGPAYLSFE